MNDTVSSQVLDYVLQVRSALADLPVEDVEEFTTGMEADLAERLAEPGDGTLRDRLGEPDAYAAELRSAAGLPPRAASVPAKKPVGQRLSGLWSDLSASVLKAMPWLRDLRPLWWAVRGFALAAVPALMIGTGIVWLGTIGAVVSVAAGLLARQGKVTGGWVSPVRILGNVAAVLLLPFAFVLLVDGGSSGNDDYYYSEPVGGQGLTNNGETVANLYAYDSTGRRLEGVRLFDQSGRPLAVDPEVLPDFIGYENRDEVIDPETGEARFDPKVFPLTWGTRTGWERLETSEWEPPMAITPLPGPVPSVGESSAPVPTVTPTTTPTLPPGATASPAPTASPKAPPTSPSSGVSATPTPTPSASR